jgi:hypothetical protein
VSVFPDSTLKWRPFPSIIDGIKPPPFVLSKGMWRGVLNLIVIECVPGTRAYGIEIIDCLVYCSFDEMICSIASHGDRSGVYNGSIYIKEAETSHLLDTWARIDPFKRKVRHFSFVGGDHCYEALGTKDPVIRAFASHEEAYAWRPDRDVEAHGT